ncbi:MAG: hypothetical protein R8K47_03930 [Mariprofundaceae bacterium]
MARKDAIAVALRPDRKGVWWDLALYVPTVGFLLLWGLKLWFAGGEDLWIAYALLFLGFFFFFAGATRIMRRLLLAPDAPVHLDVNRDRVKLRLKKGEDVLLMRELRFFSDYAGKSFALTGLDAAGGKRQFVFHRDQFTPEEWERTLQALDRYK